MLHGGLRPCNNDIPEKKQEKREDEEEEKEHGDEEVRKINPLLLATLNLSVMLWILTFISI